MLVAASRCVRLKMCTGRQGGDALKMGQPRTADPLLGSRSAIKRVMQSLAGWIGTVYSTVMVESPAIDKTTTETNKLAMRP